MNCGLLGEHLGHSYSPSLHALYGDYAYELYERPPERVEDFLKTGDWHGLNVTIPYKKTVYALCEELTQRAQRIGSVNTVVRRPDGSLWGDNTDAPGFAGTLRRGGFAVAGKKCLVLGSGGASLAVQYVLRGLGAAVAVISRTGADSYENLAKHRDAAFVVNATPVGMYPHAEQSPVALRDFPACEGVIDLIYNPLRTALVRQAESLGIPAVGGLFMLAEQARCASMAFTGQVLPPESSAAAERALRRQRENRILIGMPGAGKSTVGRAWASLLNRPFADTDTLFAESVGQSPADYLRQHGEDAFRREETRVLAEVCKESGLVIATGGGCVTREENYGLLHQNGAILLLERPLADLSTQGRPLSQGGVENLYRQRLPLYRAFADMTLENHGTPETIAEEAEDLYEHFSAERPESKPLRGAGA